MMEQREIVERILQLLEEQGKKRKDLTNYIGVSGNTFTDWKSGRIKSIYDHLSKIAKFLDTSVDYLLGNTDIKEKPTVTVDDELAEYLEELRSRPEMKMLFSLAKGATKEDVEQAVAIIEALRKGKNG